MSDYRPDNLARLEPTYLSKHHMQSAPFSAGHDDRFLYLDAARSERLALLNHMTQFSNLLLILMGEAGIGKTSLLQRFVITAQVDWRICEITANTMMDAEQMLFAAAQGYGLQQLPNDAAQLQEMLYARLATLHRQEQVPILIIHNAHTLPKEALIAVFNLADAQVEQGNLIRIILSCEPQIEKILQAKDVRPLRERVTHTMEIPPLDEAATAEYLKHRMAVAGFDGITPFTPKVVKKIFKASHGVPARINEQAHQILEHGDTTSQFDDEMPAAESGGRSYKTMVFITLAAIVVVSVFVYQDQINALLEDKTGVTTPAQTPVTAPAPPVVAKQEKIIALEPAAAPPTVTVPVTAVPASTDTAPAVVPAAPPTPATAARPTAAGAVPPAITIDIRSLDPAALPPSAKAQSMTIYGQGFTPDSKVNVSWSGHEKTLKSTQVKFINENELRLTITTGSKLDKWSVQVLDPQFGKSKRVEFAVGKVTPATTTVAVTPVAEKVTGIHDAAWIKQQAPQHYTLQLFGTHTHAAALAFIQQHKLQGELAIFYTQKQGGDWFSVVLGSYATQQAAQQASTQLPEAIQQAKPWVRRFDAVMAEIKPEKSVSAKPNSTATGAATSQSGKPAHSVAVLPAPPASTAVTQHEAWLWSQDPRHFTLQLLVSQHSDNVDRFINQHALLRAKAVYFRSHSKSRELFTVVYGVYATHQQAEAASAQLPAELRAIKPHIRTFGSIHTELDRSGQTKR
jgi:DamX protein